MPTNVSRKEGAWHLYVAPCDSPCPFGQQPGIPLSEDPEIALNMSSMLTAWKLGAQQQTAGAVSSAQTPLVLLNNKYIFWVLSPLPEEEFSLDITNKEHPTLLCVGNAPTIKEAVSPAISCIGSVLMSLNR